MVQVLRGTAIQTENWTGSTASPCLLVWLAANAGDFAFILCLPEHELGVKKCLLAKLIAKKLVRLVLST